MGVWIKQSKTDSFRQGLSIVFNRTELLLCPVAALLAYLVVRGNSEGPLFLLCGKLLTRPKLVLKLRKAVAATGLQPEKYAGHSFRIWATTTMAVCGVPVDVIKTLGRWKSKAYQLYVGRRATGVNYKVVGRGTGLIWGGGCTGRGLVPYIVSIVRLSVRSHLYMCLFDAVCYGVLMLFVHVYVLLS